ncbi:TPA: hypothetical protein N0F65_004957 [Lagenidium giganteum]|uniref:SCP domain-containing protein n=1 Tax=Lagenidium giganteum TaxID=4803 RepID=A0AAV2YJK5_9STRA|nr:TPA: hypothetical protein N0F65_004957 [Lagenidium giganteum]
MKAHANAVHQGSGPKSNGVDGRPSVHNSGVNTCEYTPEIRDYIVAKHNWARANLVPSEASNMRQVEWDESLAISAADWVSNCQFEHYTENYAYGQNLMYGGHDLTEATVDGWIQAWVSDEISDSDRRGDGMMQLNHASAVLWADTFLVGCASKMCPNGYLTACNYFNPGNYQGERTYCPPQAPHCDATGKLCSADPNGKPAYSNVTPAPYGKTPSYNGGAHNGGYNGGAHNGGYNGVDNKTPCPQSQVPKSVDNKTPCPSSSKPVVTVSPVTNAPYSADHYGVSPVPTLRLEGYGQTPRPAQNVKTPCPQTQAKAREAGKYQEPAKYN